MRQRIVFSGFLLLMCVPLTGLAASFDFAKASAKVEKAICADKELTELGERMAAAYKKQLGAWQNDVAAKCATTSGNSTRWCAARMKARLAMA